jgi:hypothetical protein
MEAVGSWCPRARRKPARGGARLSIETGPRSGGGGGPPPRGGANPVKGASDPRARRSLTRGGDWPSSEAKSYQCSAVPLERSGVPPEGG